ncbi:uncharacterized protein Triagg1_7600 [Trichoderma aggressivum f. europaeum]|uniref:Uncharacterized protein n=1 Tax=Trichoderma aggressivum f. europaeum TaxID=173218 RepID=A0AAE1LYI4_9HYPO|nr:hypothetical protein Triagg1_7600 [Trichoderma aggressivum f. europaeum]
MAGSRVDIRDFEPLVYIDLGGERLGRNGSVSLMKVLVYPGEGLERIFVIDIYTLGGAAFGAIRDAARPRTEQRRKLSGLAKGMQFIPLTNTQKAEWTLCKNQGDRVWNLDKGGSHSAFNKRPLPAEILRYCAGDVAY